MPRLAVSLSPTSAPHFYGGDPRRSIGTAAALGYDGVDVAVSGARDVELVAELVAGSGLKVGALMIGPLWTAERLSLSDPATADVACRRIIEIAGHATELGAAVVIGSVLAYLPDDVLAARRHRGRLVDALRELSEHTQELGVQLMIEPLNRAESNVASTAAAALELVAAINGRLSLVLDSYHADIEEADPCEIAQVVASQVGLAQLSDSDRQVPGEGHLPLDAWVAALRQGGYAGEFTVEANFGTDPGDGARRALQFCRARGL